MTPFRTLRAELIAVFLLVALVPLAVAMGIGWNQARHVLERELSSALRAIATRQAAQINEAVRTIELRTERLAEMRIVADLIGALDRGSEEGAAPLADEVRRQLLSGGDFENGFLVNREGRIVFSSAPTDAAPDPELLAVVERAGTILETELSDFRLHPVTGRPVAYAATPIFVEGRLLGVLALEVSPGPILRGVANYTGLGLTGETLVAVASGNDALVVAPLRRDPEAAFRLRIPEGQGAIAEAVRGGRGVAVRTDHRGVEVFSVWRYIPALRWGIEVKIDRAEAFAAVDRLGRVFAALALGTMVLVLVAAIQQAGRIAGPVVALRNAAGAVAAGDFDTPIVARGIGEIAELSIAFREMTNRLKRSFEDLRRTTEEREAAARDAIAAREEVQRMNAHLESIVAERTRELRERNAELQQTLQNLRLAQQQLVVQEKMASLGELTAGVAHEISNPLNFVNNFADLSVEACQDLKVAVTPEAPRLSESARAELDDLLPTLEENLTRIREHGRRAQRIVQGMIELTRGSSGERRVIDLSAFAIEVTRAAVQAQRSRDGAFAANVEFQAEEGLPQLPVFVAELSRALVNIVGNALWASSERARKSGPGFEPRVLVSTARRGGHLVLAVRDNGVGIEPGNMGKVFQPFYTTRPPGSGSTGLGLSMAWEIVVTQHGGKLEVESTPNSHTEFQIHLPLAKG